MSFNLPYRILVLSARYHKIKCLGIGPANALRAGQTCAPNAPTVRRSIVNIERLPIEL